MTEPGNAPLPLTKVTAYTDGSCLSNPGGPGGWAAILVHESTGRRLEISGGLDVTTNNRMEIMAVLQALKRLTRPCEVKVVTDSQYVSNSIMKKWVYGWARQRWMTKEGKRRLNADLWKEMLAELDRHKVSVTWIRGHQGHPENERCDLLARDRAMSGNLEKDPGYGYGPRWY